MKPALEWLLDSPKRFGLSVLAAVLTLIITVTALSDPGPDPQAVSAPAPTPSAQPSAPAPTPSAQPSATVTATPTERPPAEREVEAAARSWVSAWLAVDGRSVPEWRAGIRAHSTRTLGQMMGTVPPSAIPDTTITATRTRTMSSSYALVTVRLAGERPLDLAVVLEPDGWKVAQVTTGPPGSR